jgi:hypothetical protein
VCRDHSQVRLQFQGASLVRYPALPRRFESERAILIMSALWQFVSRVIISVVCVICGWISALKIGASQETTDPQITQIAQMIKKQPKKQKTTAIQNE